ncbi:MAG: hypothetical protein CUN51_01425 [Candidatus Thermofonsia Clade 1 bacterium]|uniref:Uncharacterized protein n=1 Tax=Candidatus Thermofonsia Clade 1 bacterium TaxID=2364210 RepID=A0A2M8P442_9CHLR|nr:MAG: hypothetical protein CUN51_01425 [Candidatus Thermofonsia Clade 1 bacterium]
MRKTCRSALLLMTLALLVLVGCGLPPMQLVVIISPTPDPNTIIITVTPPIPTPNGLTTPTLLPTSTEPPTVAQPVESPVPTLTPTLSAFPTETRAQLFIAHQDFQNGYMFWISTRNVIWVLINTPGNPNTGEWRIYPDTFAEGEPEFDLNLIPPSENLFQPRRGFGKLWRTTPGLREALGWATTPEFALNTSYVYQPGGFIDANGKWVPGPGKHFITTLGRQTFALIESADGVGRWERVG